LATAPVVVARSDVPVGAFVVRQGVLVARDAQGFYAMSAVCTHEGCLVQHDSGVGCPGTSAIVCACHCARYDADGRVVKGPATEDLQNFAVTLTVDSIVVDVGIIVAAGTRAPG
jgi:Rieske Fe-S protein